MNYKEEKNYKPVLEDCFITDETLLSKYHIESGKGLDVCVNKTFNDFNKSYFPLTFYTLLNEEKIVGYFCVEHLEKIKCLSGFFIKPSFRNEAIKKEFWNIVSKEMQNDFLCGLYLKNIPAIKFIEKKGGRPLYRDDESIIFYIRSKPCQY